MIHNEYSTSDIVLAAALKLGNHSLDRVMIHEGRRGVFVFRNVDDVLVDKIMVGGYMVEPFNFHNEIKHLTTVVAQLKARK